MMASAQGLAVLVTGGLGYLGSHAVVALAAAGHRVVIVDNLSNSSIEVLERIEALCERSPATYCGDVRDFALLQTVLRGNPVQCALHFAGLKAVDESVRVPLDYYDVNVTGTMTLVRALEAAGVRRLVFGSSATVYGEGAGTPAAEDDAVAPASPLARSKRAAEDLLADLCRANPGWAVTSLRCFNPAGAHPSGAIGERGGPGTDTLFAALAHVAAGRRDALRVYGADHPTPDGTGVRDYVHVVDLADAHVRAVERLARSRGGYDAINLGSGHGQSVLDVLHAYERALGRTIAFEPAPRRAGDVAASVAAIDRAGARLGWRATRDLDAICRDVVRFEAMEAARHARSARGERPLRTPHPREWQDAPAGEARAG